MSTIPVDPDMIHLATLHPGDGRALRYHLDEQMIGWIKTLAGAVTTNPYFEIVCSELDADLLAAYLEQALYMELLDSRRGLVRRQYAASQGMPFDKPVDCPAHLLGLVLESWPDSRIPLQASRTSLGRVVRAYLKNFIIERSWRWRYPSSSPQTSRPSVAVELVEGANPDLKCDAFWLANGAFDPGRALFVFERANISFFDPTAEYETIKRMGARAVALHPSVSAGGAIPIWYPHDNMPWATQLKRRFPPPSSHFERWLRTIFIHCIDRVAYWEAFSKWHSIAVFQQFTESTLETSIKRMAMQRVRGIEVGKMRSEFFDPGSAAFHFPHQVAFVWHKSVQKYLKVGRTRTQCMVETGYVYDHLFETLRPAAARLRTTLKNGGVKLVIAVYDSFPHLNTHFTQTHLISFYECVISAAEKNPEIGLIIKSKKPQVLNSLPHVRQRLSVLETAGRCHVISKAGQPVAVAALAADIGIGFPMSTALCETLLAGRMGLIYDPGGASLHPFQNCERKIVFQDIGEFKAALDKLLESRTTHHPDALFGIRSALDKYLDGKAHFRAARFIEEFLQAYESGLASLDGMRQVAARLPYCEITACK